MCVPCFVSVPVPVVCEERVECDERLIRCHVQHQQTQHVVHTLHVRALGCIGSERSQHRMQRGQQRWKVSLSPLLVHSVELVQVALVEHPYQVVVNVIAGCWSGWHTLVLQRRQLIGQRTLSSQQSDGW